MSSEVCSLNTGADPASEVRDGGDSSNIWESQVSLRVHCCKLDEVIHNTAVTKQWTAKWPYIANAVFQIVQKPGE